MYLETRSNFCWMCGSLFDFQAVLGQQCWPSPGDCPRLGAMSSSLILAAFPSLAELSQLSYPSKYRGEQQSEADSGSFPFQTVLNDISQERARMELTAKMVSFSVIELKIFLLKVSSTSSKKKNSLVPVSILQEITENLWEFRRKLQDLFRIVGKCVTQKRLQTFFRRTGQAAQNAPCC